ncbi:unnamed protein product [Caenorhabditis angaria]|uniref:MIF4G domain-containing protein n=1 Tax=Caenorhabditis angaria TaxID=860376 RepID=A0A9P1IAR8_9PELO|nr:unnamed protein product [Caenorhabditis angaria]
MEGNWNHPNNSEHNRHHVTVPGVFTESTQYPGIYQDVGYQMGHSNQHQAHPRQQNHPQQNPHQYSQQQQQQMYNEYMYQQQILRQQQQHLQRHQQHQQNYQVQMNKPTFRFNADARAFVPQRAPPPQQQHYNYYQPQPQPQPQQHQYQDAYQQHSYANPPQQPQQQQMYYDNNVIDAFAQFGQHQEQYHPSVALHDQILDCKAAHLLNEIQVGLEQLLHDGEDDSSTWATAIKQRFEMDQMDDESKKVAVKLILEMAYSMEPNMIRRSDPQYTLGCLIQTLVKEIPNFTRNILFPVLQEYHNSRTTLENDSQVLLAVFYSELFIKVTLENGSRIEQIGSALCEQLSDITRLNATDSYMKSVMRIFKLTGAELDNVPSLRSQVDDILTRMGGIAKGAPSLSESIKVQIQTLIDCRQRGWDRAPVSRVAPTTSGNNYQSEDDDSFINELTEDERQFLESQIDLLESKDGGEDELDDQEVMKEFGKFVKEEIERAEDQKTSELLNNLNVEEKKSEESNEDKST